MGFLSRLLAAITPPKNGAIRRVYDSFFPMPPFKRNVRTEQPVERRVDWDRRRIIDQHRQIELRLKLLKQEARLLGHWNSNTPRESEETNG